MWERKGCTTQPVSNKCVPLSNGKATHARPGMSCKTAPSTVHAEGCRRCKPQQRHTTGAPSPALRGLQVARHAYAVDTPYHKTRSAVERCYLDRFTPPEHRKRNTWRNGPMHSPWAPPRICSHRPGHTLAGPKAPCAEPDAFRAGLQPANRTSTHPPRLAPTRYDPTSAPGSTTGACTGYLGCRTVAATLTPLAASRRYR